MNWVSCLGTGDSGACHNDICALFGHHVQSGILAWGCPIGAYVMDQKFVSGSGSSKWEKGVVQRIKYMLGEV